MSDSPRDDDGAADSGAVYILNTATLVGADRDFDGIRDIFELAHDLDLPWLADIPSDENTTPLREACGPRIALRHRLLPVAIEGEGDERRLLLATFDPFNLIAHQAAAQELSIPFEWCMASRKRIHEALRDRTPDSLGAPRDDCDFTIQVGHDPSLVSGCRGARIRPPHHYGVSP